MLVPVITICMIMVSSEYKTGYNREKTCITEIKPGPGDCLHEHKGLMECIKIEA